MKLLTWISGCALLVGSAFALQDAKTKPVTAKPAEDPNASAIQTQRPSYPLTKCAVCGMDLPAAPTAIVHQGRLVVLCSNECVPKFGADPAKVVAQIDAAVIAAQKPSYPLEKCPISGEALGSMGDPIDFVHGTRLVRFCCKSCVKSFEKDPAPAMKQIDDALIEAQKKTYGTDQCVVSDEPLTAQGEPIDFLYGTRLVRFCCKGCIKEFRKDPAKYLTALEAARKTSDPAKKQG
jgi:YHS domain-containing protein